MRKIAASLIEQTVEELFIKANLELPLDIEDAIKKNVVQTKGLEQSVLNTLIQNMDVARELEIPICQDTGMAVVFLEIGEDVHINGLYDAVNSGVRNAYTSGGLRCSIVADPLGRVNTNDNTPALIHTEIVQGDKLRITVMPKGFGSENMSAVKMLKPSDGRSGVISAVLEIVKNAGANACPPMVIGVGIGGNFEQCALLAKKALCRSIDEVNSNEYYAGLENELLKKINELDIGAQGFGGSLTALGVNVEYAATHIAGLPMAVNIGCHVSRHRSKMI